MKTLIIIDPQNSFCYRHGELYVDGGNNGGAQWDIQRIAHLLFRKGDEIESIFVSRDEHPLFHISHRCWWKNVATGEHPPYFTQLILKNNRIYDKDGINEYVTTNPAFMEDGFAPFVGEYMGAINYLTQLAEKGRFNHTIWPEHCLQGSFGSLIAGDYMMNYKDPKDLREELENWSLRKQRHYKTIFKGTDPFVETYSFIGPEVHNPKRSARLDADLYFNLIAEDREILWTGEAASHCVRFSMEDAYKTKCGHLQEDARIDNWTFIEDCSSPVKGYEEETKQFIEKFKKLGLKVAKAGDLSWNT